jgi:two-component system, LytTR family, response regulator
MKILIIEDEQRAAQRLEKLILEIDSSIEVLDQLDSIESVLDWYKTQVIPDLLFMDIHLADGSAFEIFNKIKIKQPIIFTTAFDQYALDAFKVNAVDYLLKPIKKEALKLSLLKYNDLKTNETIDYSDLVRYLQKEQTKGLKRFLVRLGKGFKTIEIENTSYFYTENKITFLITSDGKRYPVDFSLEKLEEELDSTLFYRINRQFIVSIKSISKMVAVSKSRVKLYLEPGALDTIVSTERSGKFKKWLVGEI